MYGSSLTYSNVRLGRKCLTFKHSSLFLKSVSFAKKVFYNSAHGFKSILAENLKIPFRDFSPETLFPMFLKQKFCVFKVHLKEACTQDVLQL